MLKDIATRVIARELNLDETPVSKVMTRNPVFVLSDTLAVEALQKMVQGWLHRKAYPLSWHDVIFCILPSICH